MAMSELWDSRAKKSYTKTDPSTGCRYLAGQKVQYLVCKENERCCALCGWNPIVYKRRVVALRRAHGDLKKHGGTETTLKNSALG